MVKKRFLYSGREFQALQNPNCRLNIQRERFDGKSWLITNTESIFRRASLVSGFEGTYSKFATPVLKTPVVIIIINFEPFTMAQTLRWLPVAAKARFRSQSSRVEFVVGEVADGLVSIRVHPFCSVSVITLLLHCLSFIYDRRYTTLSINSGIIWQQKWFWE